MNLVRLCKPTYSLCLPFNLARFYLFFSFCNDDLSWIRISDDIELDVLLNVGFNENLRYLYLIMWLMSVVGNYGLLVYVIDE